MSWETIGENELAFYEELRDRLPAGLPVEQYLEAVRLAVEEYRGLRGGPALWSSCSGKETLHALVRTVGFADEDAWIAQAAAAWARDEVPRPAELEALRAYVTELPIAQPDPAE
jgi:hypothetical protein